MSDKEINSSLVSDTMLLNIIPNAVRFFANILRRSITVDTGGFLVRSIPR